MDAFYDAVRNIESARTVGWSMSPRFLRDSVVAVESFLFLAWARFALRHAPKRLLRGVLAARDGGGVADADDVVRVFSRVAARHPLSHHCLHRSIALQQVLARRGIKATLRIGLGRRPNLFPGHAWLEVGGGVVNDSAEHVARYAPLVITESALEIAYR